MTSTTVKVQVARDARTGRFIPKAEAKRRPSTTVLQTVKKPRVRRPVEVVFRHE
jgi:hypothetical protein